MGQVRLISKFKKVICPAHSVVFSMTHKQSTLCGIPSKNEPPNLSCPIQTILLSNKDTFYNLKWQ